MSNFNNYYNKNLKKNQINHEKIFIYINFFTEGITHE